MKKAHFKMRLVILLFAAVQVSVKQMQKLNKSKFLVNYHAFVEMINFTFLD